MFADLDGRCVGDAVGWAVVGLAVGGAVVGETVGNGVVGRFVGLVLGVLDGDDDG